MASQHTASHYSALQGNAKKQTDTLTLAAKPVRMSVLLHEQVSMAGQLIV
jgi:hypothetical protein